jgi:hypothetical protein
LREDNGGWDTILLLLAHGCMGILIEEIIRGKESVLVDMKGIDTL